MTPPEKPCPLLVSRTRCSAKRCIADAGPRLLERIRESRGPDSAAHHQAVLHCARDTAAPRYTSALRSQALIMSMITTLAITTIIWAAVSP